MINAEGVIIAVVIVIVSIVIDLTQDKSEISRGDSVSTFY